jgi:predicted MFS family arabinose efflux permease
MRAPESLEVLRDRPYRLLFAGQAVSLLGDGMVNVALAFAVLSVGGSASGIGAVLAARTVPTLAFLLAGGVVADRVPRRAVMLAADLARVLGQGTIAVLLLTGGAAVWSLAALSAVSGLASAFFDPASTGLLPSVVAPERLQQANALRGLAMAGGAVAGPALAGLLVAGAGAGWALAADAATFAVSAACLARLPVPPGDRLEAGGFWRDLREGWRVFVRRDWLWSIVVSASLGNALFGAYGVLGPVVAHRSLGGAAAWALISAALGAGSFVGGLVALRIRPARPLLVGTVAVALLALPLACLAARVPAGFTAAGALVGGLGLMVFNSLWETTLQRHVPPAALSRVSAYDWFGSLALTPVGYALWGPVAAAIGLSDALWLAAVLQVATVAPLLALRSVRRLPPAPAPAGA